MTPYDRVYIINNFFMAYVLYRYMMIFYEKPKTTKTIEVLSYLLYAIIMSCTIFFSVPPYVFLIISTASMFAITHLYQGSLKKRITTTILIYISLLCAEMLVIFVLGFYKTSPLIPAGFHSTIGITVISILSLFLVLFLDSFKEIRYGKNIAKSYWLCIFFVPLGTFFLFFTSLCYSDGSNTWLLNLDVIAVLGINILVFYIYNKISCLSSLEADKILIEQQNKYYANQLTQLEESQESTRAIRHDMRNHITSMRALIECNKNAEALNYIDTTLNHFNDMTKISDTGNLALDAIINYKLSNLSKEHISAQYKAIIPPKLNIDSFDLTVIIGNLLDNALEALRKSTQPKKFLNITIFYEKNMLIIQIQNSYEGKIRVSHGKLVTTKDNASYHGIGIKNVENMVSKYNGSFDIHHDEKTFSVEAIIYLYEKKAPPAE